ncbi:unannotated protein [freshwater metagenome]|uniref:Unannotated protein n=1 Tax=freshwater metagenome TaxID=449393 RepID=A0A6J7JBW1_9ZZZZ
MALTSGSSSPMSSHGPTVGVRTDTSSLSTHCGSQNQSSRLSMRVGPLGFDSGASAPPVAVTLTAAEPSVVL